MKRAQQHAATSSRRRNPFFNNLQANGSPKFNQNHPGNSRSSFRGSERFAQRAEKFNSSSHPSVPLRYKTELCRAFDEGILCKFGSGCTYAHGFGELRPVPRHPKYKTDMCRTYHTVGFCCYGARCHFVHNPEEAAGVSNMTGYLIRNRLKGMATNMFNVAETDVNPTSPSARDEDGMQANLHQLYALQALQQNGGGIQCSQIPSQLLLNINPPQDPSILSGQAAAILQQLNVMTLDAASSSRSAAGSSAVESGGYFDTSSDQLLEASLDCSVDTSMNKSSERSTWSSSSFSGSPPKEPGWEDYVPAAQPHPVHFPEYWLALNDHLSSMTTTNDHFGDNNNESSGVETSSALVEAVMKNLT